MKYIKGKQMKHYLEELSFFNLSTYIQTRSILMDNPV